MEDTQHTCVKEWMFRVGRSPHHDIRVTVRVDTVLIAAHVVGVEVDAHGLVFVDVIMEDAHGANLLRGGLTGIVAVIPRSETMEEVCLEIVNEVLFTIEYHRLGSRLVTHNVCWIVCNFLHVWTQF